VLLVTGCSEERPGDSPTAPDPSPEVISIVPTTGPEGTAVAIDGSGFGATPSENGVAFGGTAAR